MNSTDALQSFFGSMFGHFLVMLLQAVILIAAGIGIFGPIADHFKASVREETLGNIYYEAKQKVSAVRETESFTEVRRRSAELAVWIEKAGLEFPPLKNGSSEGAFALRNAKISIDAALESPLSTEMERAFATYRLRHAATEVPVDVFRKNVTTLQSVQELWIIVTCLICMLSFAVIAALELLGSRKLRAGEKTVTLSVMTFLGAAIGLGISFTYVTRQIQLLL